MEAIVNFTRGRESVRKNILSKLQRIKNKLEKSEFFKTHEVSCCISYRQHDYYFYYTFSRMTYYVKALEAFDHIYIDNLFNDNEHEYDIHDYCILFC